MTLLLWFLVLLLAATSTGDATNTRDELAAVGTGNTSLYFSPAHLFHSSPTHPTCHPDPTFPAPETPYSTSPSLTHPTSPPLPHPTTFTPSSQVPGTPYSSSDTRSKLSAKAACLPSTSTPAPTPTPLLRHGAGRKGGPGKGAPGKGAPGKGGKGSVSVTLTVHGMIPTPKL